MIIHQKGHQGGNLLETDLEFILYFKWPKLASMPVSTSCIMLRFDNIMIC